MTPQRYNDADLWGPPLPAAGQRQRMSDGEAFGGPHPSGPPPKLKADQGLGFEWGAMHPIDNLAGWAEQGVRALPGGKAVADAVDKFGSMLGLPGNAQATQQHQQAIQQAAAQGRLPGMVGQIAGNTLTTLPVMAVTGNPMLGGALSGAISTDNPHSLAGVARDTAIGAAAGKAGDMVAGGIGRLIHPQVRAPAQALINEGVQLTPGQIMGGGAKTIEDGMTHIPVVGTMIKNAQSQSVKTFNRAALNRTLSPIGETMPKGMTAGRDAVDYAAGRLSDRFDQIVPNLKVGLDSGFKSDLANAVSSAKILPTAHQKQLADILQSTVLDRVDPTTFAIAPDAMQLADRKLGTLARSYGRSMDPDQQGLGHILGDVQDSFRDMVGRQNPASAPDLNAVRTGWANLVRVEGAAGSQGAKDGVFTAGQLSSAVKAADSSVRKTGFARGNALMQDLSDVGKDVLPSSVPDSGTALRGLMEMAVLGGAGEHFHLLNPTTLGTAAAIAAPYTAPGLAASRYLLAGSRPAGAQALANAVNQYGRPVIGAGGVAASRLLADALNAQPALPGP